MFQAPKHIHFIGIGGISISGLARLMRDRGIAVSGSDAEESEITREVAADGIPVTIGHGEENLPPETDFVVYSEAVPADNVERAEADKRRISSRPASEFIGILTAGMRTIAVSGTNGKSTTTAMLGLILERAGMDPTVIVGSKVPSFPYGNVRVGKSDLIVIEADEYRGKFLNYHPETIVITNIEEDHLDYFHDLSEITETFDRFLANLRPGGTIVLNADDFASMHELHPSVAPVTYGIEEEAGYEAKDIMIEPGIQRFTVEHLKRSLGEFSLRIPGRFNVQNAMAAATAAFALGVDERTVRDALAAFPGIWRRFEIVGERGGATIVSDYGHHPTAITLTIQAAREFFPGRRIVLVFQPHQHNRTLRLFDDFVKALRLPDLAIVSDIYRVAGRDQEGDITSQDLVATVEMPERVMYGGDLVAARALAEKLMKPGDVVIVMGAGDVDQVARELVKSKK